MISLPMPAAHGRADLHTHTNASDGTLSPSEQVKWAASQGLAAVAITDHDTISGWDEAIETGRQVGIEIVWGCELSAEVASTEIHILAYYFDRTEPEMAALLTEMRHGRQERTRAIVQKLHLLGLKKVSLERILAQGGQSVGRPHIAAQMMELGIVRTLSEAFDRFLGRGRPAYVPRTKLVPQAAIQAVKRAGGVPVIAHPGLIRDDGWVRRLITEGVMGIEAYHTDHSDMQRQFYARWAADAGLICTGGTDSHGPRGMRTILPGSVNVGLEVVAELKRSSAYWQRMYG